MDGIFFVSCVEAAILLQLLQAHSPWKRANWRSKTVTPAATQNQPAALNCGVSGVVSQEKFTDFSKIKEEAQ